MAVNYVKGQILSGILERDGIDIAIANANVGINTITPTVALDVNGNIQANNLSIVSNVGANTANITGNVVVGNVSTAGNVATGNLLTDNLLYANGVPWDLEKPAGNTTEIQFNDNGNFGANINFTFDATGNLLTVNATANIANVNVAGNVAGGNILTTGVVSATGNLTAGNVSADGNVYGNNLYGNNLYSTGIVSTTGNAIAGNIQTVGQVTATGNITGGNILTVGVVSATGNVQGAFILGNGFYLNGVANSETANRLVNGTSNVDIPVTDGNVIFSVGGSSNIIVVATSGQYITGVNSVSGNITGGNLTTTGTANIATLEVTGTANIALTANVGNLNTLGVVSATGNVTGGNLITIGVVSATGNINGGNVNTVGNVTANYVIAESGVIGNVTIDDLNVGNITANGFANITGNVTGGNILFGSGIVSGAGNIYADTIFANIAGNIDAAGNINEVQYNGPGDILAASAGFTFNPVGNVLTVNGNIGGANLNTGGTVSATANVIGGNVSTVGLITATGNVTGGNLITAGVVSATSANLANLHLSNTTITTDGTVGNVGLQPTGTGIVYVNTTTGIAVPVGNTDQRPSPATTGTVRFNSTLGRLEVYDGTEWDAVVAGVTNQILYGDGSTITFTLNRSTTTAAALIMLNGITQVPDQAYSMVPNPSANLVFTEAPQTSDVIDIRFL